MPRKKSQSPYYEALFIVPNKFTDDEARGILEKVKKVITDSEGKVTYSEEWGKKKLAYPIKHNFQGYYYLVEFESTGAKIAQLDRAIKLMADVLRHQIVTRKVKSAADLQKDKAISAKIAAKQAKEKKEKEEKEEKEEIKVEIEKKDAKKVDLKDLDAKLNEILEGENLL
jgi:small subunit ribosomal protein S6